MLKHFAVVKVKVHRETPLEIHFTYLGTKDVSWNPKTYRIIIILFSKKCRYFHDFILSVINNAKK